MISLSPKSWLALAIVAVLQTGLLASIVYGRVALLRDGREIIAEVIPVDPRDFFRGDYVILNYAFSRADVPVPEDTANGDKLYVTMREAAPGQWEPVSASATLTEPADPTHVVLKGFVNHVWTHSETKRTVASMRYGIESYFVPEGTGRALEDKVRENKISAALAVGKSGDVAIKALIVDGERTAEQPWL